MLSNDGHTGLSTFMIGLIIVVFSGIALSIAVDRRLSFSSSVSSLEADTRRNEPELEQLKAAYGESSWKLLELEPKRKKVRAALESLEKSAVDLELRRATLISEREKLGKSIPVLEEQFARYRAKYRKMVRDAAIGESLGNLTVNGRDYIEASIMVVSDVGLEIRHAHGTARLLATELDAAWRDRFQWDEGAGLSRRAREDTAPKVAAHTQEAADVAERSAPDSRNIDTLRGKIIIWKAKVAQLRLERSKALSAAEGSQASVPGGLETWQARAERLKAELKTAEEELAATQAALALVLRK